VPGANTTAVEVRDLRRDEFPVAVAVLARGMRDNPLHVAAFGTNPERRGRLLEGQFGALFELMTEQTPICAVENDTIVCVTGIAPPGTCRPSGPQRLRFLPAILRAGPRAVGQVGRWLAAWGKRDPDEPHSHLGPLGVDAHVQRRGIGGRIMAEYTRRLHDAGVVGYLETNKAANVGSYERHGCVVVGQEPVIGVPNWYMRREPR
jgi:GNAT superfamily N-acetyltransferase